MEHGTDKVKQDGQVEVHTCKRSPHLPPCMVLRRGQVAAAGLDSLLLRKCHCATVSCLFGAGCQAAEVSMHRLSKPWKAGHRLQEAGPAAAAAAGILRIQPEVCIGIEISEAEASFKVLLRACHPTALCRHIVHGITAQVESDSMTVSC